MKQNHYSIIHFSIQSGIYHLQNPTLDQNMSPVVGDFFALQNQRKMPKFLHKPMAVTNIFVNILEKLMNKIMLLYHNQLIRMDL